MDKAAAARNQVDVPTVVLMGLTQSGKSSILEVVFNGLRPLDSLYIESTATPTLTQVKSLIDIRIKELPGQLNWVDDSHDVDSLFGTISSIAYVIDCQAEYFSSLRRLKQTIEKVARVNPNVHIEVLIHKIDGLSDDFRVDIQREIAQRVTDDLADAALDHLQVAFYQTSIYDRSIHEAFSRIVQRLIPEIPTLENMLNSLCVRCGIEKTFLFDVASKIYVATDKSPVNPQTYEICSDFIDVTMDIDALYAVPSGKSNTPNNTTRCVSRMHNGVVLYMSQMIRGLALVGFIREESLQKMSLLDYNVEILAQGLQRIWPQDE